MARERDVAIKIIMPSDDEVIARENAARFLLEAKAAAGIRSRHVAQVIELGLDSASAFFVMELLHGHALSSLLARERRLSPSRAVRISSQIAVGMAAAHAIGVIHRDLKPGNIMLVSGDGEDEDVTIVDFGLAKRIDTRGEAAITEAGAVLGTLQYMSPEQLLGAAVDARSDIYALGSLLYRMLTARGPFEAASLAAMIDVQLNTRPQTPSRYAAAVGPALDAVVALSREGSRASLRVDARPRRSVGGMGRVADAGAALGGDGAAVEAWSSESGPITPRLVAEAEISPPTEPLTLRAGQEACLRLDVSNTVVKKLIKANVLPARQGAPLAPWEIDAAALETPEVKRAVERTRDLGSAMRAAYADKRSLTLPGVS